MITLLRHDASIPLEDDGAVRFDDLFVKCKELMFGEIPWQKVEERGKGFNVA